MIFIVIPVHNRKKFTHDCLISLRNQTYKDFKTVIIDDGSTDGTKKMLEVEFPEVHVIKGNGNLWWTGGVNLGIEYVLKVCKSDDYVLLMNNDLIVEENYIDKLVSIIKNTSNSIIGSVEVLTTEKQVIRSGGVVVDKLKGKLYVLNEGKKLDEFTEDYIEEVSALTGRGTLYPVSVFKEIGLFDQYNFPHYGDFELPFRATKRGYKLFVYYNLIVQSFPESAKSSIINKKKEYKINEIKEYFFNKYSHSSFKFRWKFSKQITNSFPEAMYFYSLNMLRITFNFFINLKVINRLLHK